MTFNTVYIAGLLVLGLPAAALAERAMEPVMTIPAGQAERLLGDEQIMVIPSAMAHSLLDDPQDSAMRLDEINNMPATAAGQERILMISPEAAEALLGDQP